MWSLLPSATSSARWTKSPPPLVLILMPTDASQRAPRLSSGRYSKQMPFFGFPATSPYDDVKLIYCHGNASAADRNLYGPAPWYWHGPAARPPRGRAAEPAAGGG